MEKKDVMNSCFNIMRRLPLGNMKMNVAGLSSLIQDEQVREEFIQKID